MKPTVFCLMGPTASGKTALSLALSAHSSIEIINVDSAQIYQGMDIGTGKPSKTELAQVPHHLIDILDPAVAYSAAQFREDALKKIDEIIARGCIPVLVGGSMLYFKALQQGLSKLPSSCPLVREQLNQQLAVEGLANLYQQLQRIDPVTAARLSPTDPQRILRALEVYTLTQKPMSTLFLEPSENRCEYHFINIGLIPQDSPRALLHEGIAIRFQAMLDQGLVPEVENLLQRADLHDALPALRSVGYRQVIHYLRGEITFSDMQEKATAATRQLAKRQLTWLRQWPQLITFDFLDPHLLNKFKNLLNEQGSVINS
jgi:tRNA dimethylallyltransferase